jgi:hypothetical protein
MPTKYQGLAQRQVLEDSVRSVDKMMADPIIARGLRRKQNVMKDYKSDKAKLKAITPPAITSDAERKKLEQRAQDLEQAMVKGNRAKNIEPMLSEEDHWEAPTGSIGSEGRWSDFWQSHTIDRNGKVILAPDNYSAIDEWKDTKRTLGGADREEVEPDLASIESIRPRSSQVAASEFQTRTYGLSERAKENYDQIFPDHEPTPVELKLIAQEKELAEMKAQLAALSGQPVPQEEPEVEGPPAPKTEVVLGRCKFVNAKSKRRCKNRIVPGSLYCNHPAHRPKKK